MNLSLANKNAFVCGSSQGIGKAIAIELALLGANVTLIARNQQRLEGVLAELDNTQKQVHDTIVVDFSNPVIVKSMVQDYLQRTGKTIHILINNTGGPPGGPITEATPDDFLKALHMHLLCNHTLTQQVAPGMKKVGYGRIIQIISTSVKEPIPGLGVSNTTRGAVANWAKTMAGELGPFGITVNNILPGFVKTQRLESIVNSWAEKNGQTPEEYAKGLKSGVPARRFAEAKEVGQVAAFLASPAAGYINGINLPVDGGRTRSL